MQTIDRINRIKNWILSYCKSMPNEAKTLVVGISGGIDSSVSSTLCALTGKKTIVLSMPINQIKDQHNLSLKHQEWLKKKFKNVEGYTVELDNVFKSFKTTLSNFKNEHGLANSRARLRMATLYQVAASNNGIVVGTGNKVEDFGVGFYTKYGDGGVDISPIADCTKTEVWEMGKSLGITKEIIDAEPTDGLWDDGRTDVKQLGMTYIDLENAMNDKKSEGHKKYLEIRKKNLHKMKPIPVCMMDDE
ncbi:MAG: NAD(+) synthase [Candidatus Marinimicrobia bacterium]|nr:NAD(+) synthase [Candidatus Neomarinimicrobiota bacterium]RPG05260.1 MAG: NAD(+) synthase [Pelagibacteraceae bacterium TMED247]